MHYLGTLYWGKNKEMKRIKAELDKYLQYLTENHLNVDTVRIKYRDFRIIVASIKDKNIDKSKIESFAIGKFLIKPLLCA